MKSQGKSSSFASIALLCILPLASCTHTTAQVSKSDPSPLDPKSRAIVKDNRFTPEERAEIAAFNKALDSADTELEHQRYASALERINDALQMRPNHPFALQIRSEILEKKGDLRAALQDAYEIIAVDRPGETNISTDAAFISRALLLAERLDDQEKRPALLAAAQESVDKTRTYDGMPLLDPTLSTRDAVLWVAVKDCLFHGDAEKAGAFLGQVRAQDKAIVDFYRAEVLQETGHGREAREMFKDLSEDPRAGAALKKQARWRGH